ncbi:MAG: hypothetical protein NVV70_06545 [Cellulomonas sp.]|nr:hypothetical protein [Cellulomonas sp.]MCR6647803.1 hypothetical protein [Cellulomonas sp.]
MTGARQLEARWVQPDEAAPGPGHVVEGLLSYSLSGAGLGNTTPFKSFYTWYPDSAGFAGDRWSHSGRFRFQRTVAVEHPAWPEPYTAIDLHGPSLVFLDPDLPDDPALPLPPGAIGYELDGGLGNITVLARTLRVHVTTTMPSSHTIGVRVLPPEREAPAWWTRYGPLGPPSQLDPSLHEPAAAFTWLGAGTYAPQLGPGDVWAWPAGEHDELVPGAGEEPEQRWLDVPVLAGVDEVAIVPYDSAWSSLVSGPTAVDYLTEIRGVELTSTVQPPRYRYLFEGAQGQWRVRQRQTLSGADSWPIRQRQAGGHSGSWTQRQRQTGV